MNVGWQSGGWQSEEGLHNFVEGIQMGTNESLRSVTFHYTFYDTTIPVVKWFDIAQARYLQAIYDGDNL